MKKLFFELVSSGLGVAAVLCFIGGLLNTFFDWNLLLGEVELPYDFTSTLVCTAALAVMAGVFWALANPKHIAKHKGLVIGLALASVAGCWLLYHSLSGGGLGAAVAKNDEAAVAKQLQAGGYAQAQLDGMLYQSLKKGHLKAAEALLQGGADPNRLCLENATPLVLEGTIFFSKEAILFLIERADCRRTDALGRNGLHTLLLYRRSNFPNETSAERIEILQAFVDGGVEVNKAWQAGETPLQLAETNGEPEIASWLEAQGTK